MFGFPLLDLRRFEFLLSHLQPFDATFVQRSAESTKIRAPGPCDSSTLSVRPGNLAINTTVSRVQGTVEGCTTELVFLFGGANTRGFGTAAVSFFYGVPAARLLRGVYSFTTDEQLSGRVRLNTLTTLNSGFTSEEECDFFANFSVKRIVHFIDGAQTVLRIEDVVAGEGLSGNSRDDSFLGGAIGTNIDVVQFVSSQFAVSGDDDLTIRFDYIFSATAKGDTNNVIFTGLGGNGGFSIRNRQVTLSVQLASLAQVP